MKLGPPKDVPPHRLFQILCEWRPRQRIPMKLDGLEGVQLWAQAVPSTELARCTSPFEACALAIVGDNREPVFTPESLGMLTASEWTELQAVTGEAFARICPTAATSDIEAWRAALKHGAPKAGAIYHACQQSFDFLPGFKEVVMLPRPDRMWGRPLVEMLDGHHLVMRVVRELMR